MPVDRPTFSESWYRVAGLRPRLRGTVQVFRQHYRGRMWHVLQDPGSNQFFRLNESAYVFVALLDGKRTVAEAWEQVCERMGDDAPTQNEAIQLLGQLYVSNLVSAELPPDAAGLFERYRKRVGREIRGYLANFLFLRIPLLDPDHFLQRWMGVFGRLFTRTGLVLWLALMATGLYFMVPRLGELTSQTTTFFSRQNLLGNLPLLYATIVVLKVIHEFGHGFACRWFGRHRGGGEVHTMGIMLLVFTPLPYVDASSAWAFRSKWHRIVVSAAGMYVELAVAAIAAIVWAHTAVGDTVNTVAYNAIFIASVSTILFNANPLLRYDGYYILSDWLEMPNLQQRSKQYLYYLVKRYVWRVRRPTNPSHSVGERPWLVIYALASTVYRVVICVAILMFVMNRFFFLGAALAMAAVVAWVLVPLGKFAHYLLTHQELARTRGWAVVTVLVAAAGIVAGVGLVPVPDRTRVVGFFEPAELAKVYVAADGVLTDVQPDGADVSPEGRPLVSAESLELEAELARIDAEQRRLERLKTLTYGEERQTGRNLESTRQQLDQQLLALVGPGGKREHVRARLAALAVHAPLDGHWIAPGIERLEGATVRRGAQLGMVAGGDRFVIRAVADASQAARIEECRREVEIRLARRPDIKLSGRWVYVGPKGSRELPSAALGYAAGGSIMTAAGDGEGTRAAANVYEVHIEPDAAGAGMAGELRTAAGDLGGLRTAAGEPVQLRSGQRVVVRLSGPPRPLALQWWRALRQMLERRQTGQGG